MYLKIIKLFNIYYMNNTDEIFGEFVSTSSTPLQPAP